MVFSSIYISAFLGMFVSFCGLSTPLSKQATGDSIRILFQHPKLQESQAKIRHLPHSLLFLF